MCTPSPVQFHWGLTISHSLLFCISVQLIYFCMRENAVELKPHQWKGTVYNVRLVVCVYPNKAESFSSFYCDFLIGTTFPWFCVHLRRIFLSVQCLFGQPWVQISIPVCQTPDILAFIWKYNNNQYPSVLYLTSDKWLHWYSKGVDFRGDFKGRSH